MGRADRERLRLTFDEVPDLYDKARPVYPDEVFDDIVALARLATHARVLEIGCGTGQATLPLARRGFELTCVELGAQLATVARRKLAAFAKVEIVNANFETWDPGGRRFDAVVAFTAFRWVDPELRYAKSAAVLDEEGRLAVVDTQHVWPDGTDPFWAEVQEDYDAVAPDPENRPPPRPDAVGDLSAEIAASGRFENVAARRFLWDVTYTADEYIAVLDTYSGHRSFDDDTRRRLYERIHSRIEARPGATVSKTYLATLNVARRV